ncbi:hypothetical protein [Streptomyces sp. NPDC058441]|uniref:hypothetical protein n=1 Tax=Streptomyces sp. NPDC058441 TaxID=3346502 RepID=UPI00365440C4
MHSNVDITATIDPAHLSPELRKLIAKRDAAHEALLDFEAEHYATIADNWLAIAEAADIKAAILAVDAGEDPMELPSEQDRVRSLRPKILALYKKHEREARSANAAVATLYRREAPAQEEKAHERMGVAVKAAEEAYSAFLTAYGIAGGTMNEIRHLRDWSTGGRSDAGLAVAAPIRADGYSTNESGTIGALREAVATYAAPFEPVKRVRVLTASGAELVLSEDQAKAIVGSNSDPAVKILGPAD